MRCIRPLLIASIALMPLACGGDDDDPNDIGLEGELISEIVASGLMNPSGVCFDAEGTLYICDAGNGRVMVRRGDTKPADIVTGFDTEFWKVDKETGA